VSSFARTGNYHGALAQLSRHPTHILILSPDQFKLLAEVGSTVKHCIWIIKDDKYPLLLQTIMRDSSDDNQGDQFDRAMNEVKDRPPCRTF